MSRPVSQGFSANEFTLAYCGALPLDAQVCCLTISIADVYLIPLSLAYRTTACRHLMLTCIACRSLSQTRAFRALAGTTPCAKSATTYSPSAPARKATKTWVGQRLPPIPWKLGSCACQLVGDFESAAPVCERRGEVRLRKFHDSAMDKPPLGLCFRKESDGSSCPTMQ